MFNKNNYADEIPTKLKHSKTKIIISIIIVLIVMCISTGVYAIIKNNPKTNVFNALKATSEQLKNKESFIQKITDKDFSKVLKTSGTRQDMEFTLNSASDKNLKKFVGCGISVDSLSEEDKKMLMMNVAEKYKGKEFLNASFFTDNNKLMLSMPKLYDGWFACDAENIQDQYNNSFFAQNGKQMSSKELSLKLFGDDDVKEYYGKELFNVVINGYVNENKDKLEKIQKDIRVSTIRETKSIEASGQKEECTGYNIKLSGNDAKTIVDSFYDYMLTDKHINKMITKYANYAYLANNKNYSNSEVMIDDIYTQMKDYVNKFKDSYTCEEVTGTVYVDPKGRAVSIELNSDVNGKDEKKKFEFLIDFRGYNNVANTVKMSIDLDGDKEKFNINLNDSSTVKDDLINDQMKLVVHSNKDPLTFNEKDEYNKKDGQFNASVSVGSRKEELSLALKGNGSYDKTSKTLKFDFNDINIKTIGIANPINISLTGGYLLAPIEKEIEAPNGQNIELFKLTKDEFDNIMQQIKKNKSALSGTSNEQSQKY